MTWEIGIAIFIALCTALATFCTSLAIIVGAVYFTIKKELQPLLIRLDRLEKDESDKENDIAQIRELLTDINKKVLSRESLQKMIDFSILECQKLCTKK